jgi:hypothetical protein
LSLLGTLAISSIINAQDFLDIENAPSTITDTEEEEGTIFDDDLEIIDDLTIFRKKNEPTYKSSPKTSRFKRPSRWMPTPFTAYLQKNSIITRIDDESVSYRVKKQVLVKAEEVIFGGQYSRIYDSKGNLKFRTLTKSLVDITTDVNLNPNLPSHEEFEPPTQLHTTNKSQLFENSFYWKVDTLNLGYYNDMFNTSDLVGTAERFEYRIFPKWKFPIDFGITFSSELGISVDEDGNSLTWTSYYFGPAIKYVLSDNKIRAWEVYAGIQTSISYVSSLNGVFFEMSSNAMELELLWKRKTKWGVFIIGGSLRQQDMNLNPLEAEETEIGVGVNFPREPARSTITSLGISLGYQFSFEL